jgi:hypothetical protein
MFNENETIEIFFQKGISPKSMAVKLKEADLIQSTGVFVAIVKLLGW